jgi:integrase/recombinase XerD
MKMILTDKRKGRVFIPNCVKDYKSHLELQERNLAQNTIKQYYRYVLTFNGWLFMNRKVRNKFESQWDEIKGDILLHADQKSLLDFFSSLFNKHMKKTTRNLYKSAIADFFRWANYEGITEFDPNWAFVYIRKSNTEKKLKSKTPLNREKVDSIRDYLAKRKAVTPLEIIIKSRDMALLEVLVNLGVRVNEVISLKVSNVYFEKGYINIYGMKTSQNKDGWRMVPTSKNTLLIIKRYIDEFVHHYSPYSGRSGGDTAGYLFPTIKRTDRVDTSLAMNERTIGKTVERWAIGANVEDLSPHRFRHYFITKLCELKLESGHNMFSMEQLSQIAGCETTTIQKHYYHPSHENMLTVFHQNGIQL